jgi:putative RNA 2'-phosphotransferase
MPAMNLKSYFSSLGFAKKGFGLKKAMNILEIHQNGVHRALVDATNTAKLLPFMHRKANETIALCGGTRLLNKNKLRSLGTWVCKLLRHEPSLIGAEIDSQGWMDIDTLLNGGGSRKPIALDELKELVDYDSKGRLQFCPDGKKIRCLQGHSLPHVQLDFKQVVPKSKLYHGSSEESLLLIKRERYIKGMSRNLVHLSADIKTAISVGRRHGKPIVYEINTEKLNKLGHQFYISENGIYLSEDIPLDCATLLKP